MLLRRTLYVLAALAVLAAILILMAKRIVGARATPEIQSRLQTALGMPVEVTGTDVGISGDSEVVGVKVYEPAAAPTSGNRPAEPWLRIERIVADVSVIGLLKGSASPAYVRLEGVSVTLRFDKDGNLQTKLPGGRPSARNYPRIEIGSGKLTLDQEGREPLAVEGVRGTLAPDGAGLRIAGTIADRRWGNWDVGGRFAPADGTRIALHNPHAEVSMDRLRRLPFVPPAVWQQVSAEGTTDARLTLEFPPAETQKSKYRVELEPAGMGVRVSSIDLDTREVTGKLVVQDEVVTLTNLSGQTAEGTLAVSGTLDFRPAAAVLDLGVTMRRVTVRELPRSWDIPQELDGKLDGSARIHARLTEPVVDTDGSSGVGNVSGVSVLGLGNGTAKLYLHAGPGRFWFRQEQPGKRTSRRPDRPVGAVAGDVLPRPDFHRGPAIGGGVAMMSDGFTELATSLATGATSTVRWLRQINRPPPAGKEPTYFQATLSLQDVDLAELVRRAKLNLPFRVGGQLSFQVKVEFPLDRPRDFRAYRFEGEAQLPRFIVSGLAMANVQARLRYADGVLTVESLRAELPGADGSRGTVSANGRYRLLPLGDLVADVRLERVPLDLPLRLLPGVRQAKGTASGELRCLAAEGRITEPAAWDVAGRIRSERISAYGLTVTDLSAALTIAKGTAIVSDFQGDCASARVAGNGRLRLGADFAYEARLAAAGVQLAFLEGLQPNLRPPFSAGGRLDLTLDLKGTLWPLAADASGMVRATDLALGGARVSALSGRFQITPDRLAFTEVTAELFGGTARGSATLPRKPAETGMVSLQVQDVEAVALSKALHVLPVRIEGRVSGSVRVYLLATTPDKPRATAGSLDLTAAQLRLQGLPAERVRGHVSYQAGAGDYRLEGELAGGTFNLEGSLPPRASADPQARPAAPPADPPCGTLRIRGVRLAQLARAMVAGRALRPLHGVIDVDLTLRVASGETLPGGRGTFTVSDLRWGDRPLTERLQGKLEATAEGIRVSDVSAPLGSGYLRMRAGYQFARESRNYVDVDMYQIDAGNLLAPYEPLTGLVEGPLDVNFRLTGSGELRGSGRAELTRGRVLGVEVADWQVPFDVVFMSGDGGQLDVRDSSARVAQGRATGRATCRWGASSRLEGGVRFYEVELRGLVGPNSEVRSYVGGRIAGTLEFSADDLRSAADLNATLAATLSQAQPMGLPVLQQAAPLLGLVGAGLSTRFQSGELKGRLSREVFRLEHFTLTSSVMQLIVEGNVTLAGLLDLDLTAGSGDLLRNSPRLQILGLRLPAIGPLPLTLVAEASSFLAGRLVHLHVTGTFRNPVVRVVPTAVFSSEAVGFFLGRGASR